MNIYYILCVFPRKSDNITVATYCILYAKQYIYLEILKNKTKNTNFNLDFMVVSVISKIYIKNGRKHMY